MTYYCPACWAELPTEEATCPRCGTDPARAWQGRDQGDQAPFARMLGTLHRFAPRS
jgi:predicted amidophosphoribosyltransferase